jgi:hypothetical protein
VDFLAHEYGWAKNHILENVYLDELYKLLEQARIRKVREWKMQLAIASNPHVKDPKTLYRMLDEEERRNRKLEPVKFDAGAFEVLKQRISDNPRIIVK